jgi:hypothetical protein
LPRFRRDCLFAFGGNIDNKGSLDAKTQGAEQA